MPIYSIILVIVFDLYNLLTFSENINIIIMNEKILQARKAGC